MSFKKIAADLLENQKIHWGEKPLTHNPRYFLLKLPITYKLVKHQKKSLVLRSMQKSGTNYLRLILTNYFVNVDNFLENGVSSFSRIDYDHMHNQYFPNVRHNIFDKSHGLVDDPYKLPTIFRANYRDFMYDHGCELDNLPAKYLPMKMLLLFRNPLDQMVSFFYYKYKYKVDKNEDYNHPRELLGKLTNQYISKYKKLVNLNKKLKENSMLISYEQLMTSPHSTIESLLYFMNFPVYPKLISLSVAASSKKEVKKEEAQRGGAIHGENNSIKKSHIRSGKIGEWKEYFSNDDLDFIKEKFEKNNMPIELFNIENYYAG